MLRPLVIWVWLLPRLMLWLISAWEMRRVVKALPEWGSWDFWWVRVRGLSTVSERYLASSRSFF